MMQERLSFGMINSPSDSDAYQEFVRTRVRCVFRSADGLWAVSVSPDWRREWSDESGKEKPGHRGRACINQFCGRGTTSIADDQYLARTGAGAPQLKW